MAEEKTFKIENQSEIANKITAEVPGEQKFRQMDANSDFHTDIGSEITDTECTLSPVITVTKKETVLTKGDLKLQKITVSEDVAIEEVENGGHRISYSKSQIEGQTNDSIDNKEAVTKGIIDKVDNNGEKKKSKIPQLSFKQGVEIIKKGNKEKRLTDKAENSSRRSSIPKLTDSKKVKMNKSVESEEQLEDEFDKIFEEIVDNNQKEIDKILTVQIDDPEKIETKFEEIIHAYDSNDDQIYTEKLKLSKIPFRKRNEAPNRIGSVADGEQNKNTAPNSELKDGGFKISANTITIKRFSRGSSTDLNNSPKIKDSENTETVNDNSKENGTVSTETGEVIPIEKKIAYNRIETEINLDDDREIKAVNQSLESKDKREIAAEVDNISKDTINRQNIKTGIPVKPERMHRSISKDLNKRPLSLQDRDFVNREVGKHEEIKVESQTTGKEKAVKKAPVKPERLHGDIKRTFSKDGKSITVTPRVKDINNHVNKIDKNDITIENNKDFGTDKVQIENTKVLKADKSKETIEKGIPVFTKTNHYSRGTSQTIEITKTLEWEPAAEVERKTIIRSFSENKSRPSGKNTIPTNYEPATVNIKLPKENDFDNKDNITENTGITTENNSDKMLPVVPLKVSAELPTALRDENFNSGKSEVLSLNVKETETSVQDNIEEVKRLKGNVSRLVSQISVKETQDASKREVVVEADLPKKKTVFSRIAKFEGHKTADKTENKSTVRKSTPISVDNRNIVRTAKVIGHVLKPQSKSDSSNAQNKINNEIESEPAKDQSLMVGERKEDDKLRYAKIRLKDGSHIGPLTSKRRESKLENNKPKAVDSKVSQTNKEQAQVLDVTQEFDSNGVKVAELVSDEDEKFKDLPQSNESEKEAEVSVIENTDLIQIQYKHPAIPIKIDTENQTELNKPKKVGKLDLTCWRKQVEANQKPVNKHTLKQPYITTQKPTKIIHEINENKVETAMILPDGVEITSDGNPMLTVTSEAKLDTHTHNIASELLPDKLDFVSSDKHLQVPVILPETPITKLYISDFETQKSQIDVPIIEQENIGTEFNKSSENICIELPQILPEHASFAIEQYKIESPKIIAGVIEFNNNGVPLDNPVLLSDNVDNYTQDKTLTTGATDINEYENKVENDLNNISEEEVIEMPNVADAKIDSEDINIEILSDPELVDSEPEIKETKASITGILKKNKYYISTEEFISNIGKNEELQESNLDISKNNDNTLNVTENNDSKYKEYIIRHDEDTTSISERSSLREELKRTKSLAELDLGDAVKGQVQKMVFRLKSVDFEKIETPRARKISIREMPRKMSVLEKIALFEGKVNSKNFARIGTSKTETLTADKKSEKFNKIDDSLETVTPVHSTNDTGLTEEEYLRKIEDLSTAKVRYGKTNVPSLKLVNGQEMPPLALGTALVDSRLAPHLVAAAIDLGYRAIDTAYIYGNEREVGRGIKTKLDEGTVTREELFIMSKLWSTYHHPDLVEPACRASLEALGIEYFDLFMIHNPMSFREGGEPIPKIATVIQYSEYDYLDAWFAMEKLVSKGLVRSIGVSNFNSQQIQRILDKGRLRPVVNQVESHPYLSQLRLQNYCSDRNITLSCFGVLGSKGTPAEYKSGVPAAIDDPLIVTLASGLNMSPGQLLVRFQTQLERNVVVKSSTAAHLWDVLNANNFLLEPHQLSAIAALNKNKRIFTFNGMGETHKNYPFNEPF